MIYFTRLGGCFNNPDGSPLWKKISNDSIEGKLLKRIVAHFGGWRVNSIHHAVLPIFHLGAGYSSEIYLFTFESGLREKSLTQYILAENKSLVETIAGMSNCGEPLCKIQELSFEDINVGYPEWVNDAFNAIQETLKANMPKEKEEPKKKKTKK